MRLAATITALLLAWQLYTAPDATGYGPMTNVKLLWWLRTGLAAVLVYALCKSNRGN